MTPANPTRHSVRIGTRPIESAAGKRAAVNVDSIPELEGVEHRLIDLGGGVTIHVADAGPADGPPVMLVHGFPQNWWEWHELIGPLAADGYRVLCRTCVARDGARRPRIATSRTTWPMTSRPCRIG